MMTTALRSVIPFFFTLLFYCTSSVSFAIAPALLEQLKTQNVVDTTQTLTAAQLQQLKSNNEAIFQQQHIDLKILMIATLQEQPVENYAYEVFDTLKIGDKEKQNGLLLLIVKDDRKMRIEVGRGLEGDIPDIIAGRIIRQILAPHFKQDDYYTGIALAQNRLGGLDLPTSLTVPAPEPQPHVLAEANTEYVNEIAAVSSPEEEEHVIHMEQASRFITNYLVFLLWNIALSVVLVIYFAPIYTVIRQSNYKIQGITSFLCLFLPLHHLFCWVITGLNFFLLIGLYVLILYVIACINRYWDFYQFSKRLQRKHQLIFAAFIIISMSSIALGIDGINLTPLIMFFLLSPVVFLFYWLGISSIAKGYKAYYPAEYQHWFTGKPNLSQDSSSSGSWSISVSSSGSSSSWSSSSSSSSSSNSRSSGGSSAGGGASGDW